MKKKIAAIVQCILVQGISFIVGSTANAVSWLHVEGNQLKDSSGKNIVLRGTDTADLDVVAYKQPGIRWVLNRLVDGGDKGFDSKVVRLVIPPDRWNKNPDVFFNSLLKPAVDYCIKKDIYCIIDWHSFGDENGQYTSDRVNSELRGFWSYVAPKFKNVPNIIYELFNEPEYPDSWDTWRKTAQPWVDLIRASAPRNIILVGNPLWDTFTKYASTSPFTGSNLMYTVHLYPGNQKSEADYNKMWDDIFGNAMQSVPVFASEWGYVVDDGVSGCQKGNFCGTTSSFGKPLRNYVENKHPNLNWSAWDYGYSPSLVDSNYNVLGGDNYEGQFVQQWLRDRKNK